MFEQLGIQKSVVETYTNKEIADPVPGDMDDGNEAAAAAAAADAAAETAAAAAAVADSKAAAATAATKMAAVGAGPAMATGDVLSGVDDGSFSEDEGGVNPVVEMADSALADMASATANAAAVASATATAAAAALEAAVMSGDVVYPKNEAENEGSKGERGGQDEGMDDEEELAAPVGSAELF